MQRLTKIICTWGPATCTPKQFETFAHHGMNVVRFNLSHGTWEKHRATLRIIEALNRKLASQGKLPTCIATLLDTVGAEVRTGTVSKPIAIEEGELVVFSPHPCAGEKKTVILVNHKKFALDAKDAEEILLDNGKMTFTYVSSRKDGSMIAKAGQSGTIGSRRHVNLPGANLRMPSITKEDWECIEHAANEGMDFVALSFVRKADEVEEVRSYLKKRGKSIGLMAKIETRQAVENLHEILEASDALMVARGDLGAEIPFERIPVLQDDMVALCRSVGKPVVVATHMLESMIENPTPTRAEVTDIAHAAMTLTDSTMLSGESAGGAHPLLALEAMDRVLRETENYLGRSRHMWKCAIRGERDAQAEAAVSLAVSSKAAAIIVITKSGQTALDVVRFRPQLPIIACTPEAHVQRRLALSFGVIPIVVPFAADPESTVQRALKIAKRAGLLKKGQDFVIVSDAKAHAKMVSSVQVRTVS